MVCLGSLLLNLPAEEPAKKSESVKPPWQRLLQGEDAKKAEEQEKKLVQLQEAGQFTEALKVAQALADLRAKVQGADHWEAVNARFDVETIRRVLKANKEEQQSYGHTFGMQREAEALVAKGRYREAQSLFEQVLSICLKVLGEQYPNTATSYHNLSVTLNFQGKSREAEVNSRKALAIKLRVLGAKHPDTAFSYNSLGLSLNAQGKYKEAEECYRKALAIERKVLGEEYPATARGYNNLAGNLSDQGNYKEAEEGHHKALAILRKVLGEEHPDTAASYNNLAYTLNAQGKYREADEGYQKALAIKRKVLGKEHPDTAISYNNLAYNQSIQGKYREAEDGFRKALAIWRKILGEEHPLTTTGFDNLAGNQDAQGEYQKAEEGHRKALAIWRKILGQDHPLTARGYNNLAYTLGAQGNYKEGEESLRKALAIHHKVMGEEHPHTARSYNNLASNLNAQGNYQEAETFWGRAADSFAKIRLHVATTGLERAAFTSERSPSPALAALLARNGKPNDAWQRFEESLARGTWDDLSARLRRPQAERDQQAQITARIERLNKLIERASMAKPTPEQAKQRDEWLSQLRQAYDELAAFTQQLEEKHGPIAGQVFACGRIQEALPADAAFVAWLDISGQLKAADPDGEHWAILLRSSGDPIWVRLVGSGDNHAWTDADTQLPARLREALQSPRGLWQPLAQRLRKQRLDPLATHLKDVRHLIVLPSTALAGVPLEVIADGYTISYAHSGTTYAHLLRQPTPTSKGLFVLADPVFDIPTEKEKPQPLPSSGVLLSVVVPGSNAAKAGLKPNDVLLHYGDTNLASPTDLKPQPESIDPNKRVPVVVWREGQKLAQPLFVRPGKLGVVFAQEPAPRAVAEQRRIDRLLASRGGEDGKWDRLPGTRIEAASLQQLFDKDAPVQLLVDSDASEQHLNELAQRGELSKYRYIHLATHGEVNDTFPLRSAVILSRDHLPGDNQRTELLLSGQPIPDGRLEAEEALQRWNLQCDLVTLSACQTALGKYERGEGFVGFAQSLILCGTRSVCLSLWKVDDTATALLMERFYQNLLGKREGLDKPMAKAAALTEAKRWLRTLSRDEAMKRAASLTEGVSRGKGAEKLPPLEVPPATTKTKADDRPFAHPYYWAAFVLVGQAD
jgi:tetratricopeptide (TPR) repeat protein